MTRTVNKLRGPPTFRFPHRWTPQTKNHMWWLIFILSCYGMTNIIAYGKIFDRVRPRYHFFRCPMCLGFWVGIIVFALFWVDGIRLFENVWVGMFLCGCVSSGTSYMLVSSVDDSGVQVNFKR